eukprot:TRINITY_DN6047_c0_g1_i8.p1 TRINITY_DN6047_c0_g1~~TRINITY_DN6047_c0_g1_i8.p1  ORF type:complete len:558 (-),score=180.17 TRINITY_DN6047_c0_g1_i8:229-1902(-)
MGKRDKKKKRDKKDKDAKAKKQEKVELKTEKIAKKRARRQAIEDDEEDIEALIAHFKMKDAEIRAVTVEVCARPSPRTGATLVAHPMKDNELILFGGESFQDNRILVYNEMFIYNVDKNEWKQVSSPSAPPPRCAHQVVCAKNCMYVIGGEFTSPSQNQFYHYKDIWKFNLATNQWEEIKPRGGPSARSGHRAIVWKRKICLFGGFHDLGSEVRYHSDFWTFDIDTERWAQIEMKVRIAELMPSARSACSMGIHGEMVYVYGGYSREKVKDSLPKGVVHSDLWALDMRTNKWEKVKKAGIPPSPRSGMGAIVDRTRLLILGGVYDEDKPDELSLVSTFYNDIYAFHMDSRRWFPMKVRSRADKPKARRKKKEAEKQTKGAQANEESDSDESAEEEEEAPEARARKPWEQDDDDDYDYGFDIPDDTEENGTTSSTSTTTESAAPPGPSSRSLKVKPSPSPSPALSATSAAPSAGSPSAPLSPAPSSPSPSSPGPSSPAVVSKGPMPSPRINPLLAIVGSTLYIYGGVFEAGDREVIYNDLWALNVNKMDGYKYVIALL